MSSGKQYEYYTETRPGLRFQNSVRQYVTVQKAFPVQRQKLDAACDDLRQTVRTDFAGADSQQLSAYGRRLVEIFDELIPSSGGLRLPTHFISLGFRDALTRKSRSYAKFPLRLMRPGTNAPLNETALFGCLDMAINSLPIPDAIDRIGNASFDELCFTTCLRALFAGYVREMGYAENLAALTIDPFCEKITLVS